MDFDISDYFSDDEIALVKQEAPRAEQLGQWTDSLITLSKNKRLFHLFVPKVYGGFERSLPQALPWLEAASYLDGSFGWTLTLGAGAVIFAAFMKPDFATKVFADDTVFIAGSGFPGGKAEPISEGYRINGHWKYNSGFDHATLITVSCYVTEKGFMPSDHSQPEIKAFAFYPDEVQKADKWESYGLKATGSHNIKVSDVVVPKDRSFEIAPGKSQVDGLLYGYPFEPFAQSTLGISLIGIEGHFLDKAREVLFAKYNANSASGLPDAIFRKFSKAEKQFYKAREQVYLKVEQSWEEIE
ncbi:MAG TPA: hypothetical protein VJ964_04330, partial [Balneolaceae bacterium]|nr:hypothetical protein [Balneolaceae bacterium]